MNKPLNKNTLTPNLFTNFAYNGMKLDNEVSGNGNSYTAEFWQYDARLGRRWNVDPMAHEREWVSPYNFVQNNPILRIDPNGALDDKYEVDKSGNVNLTEKTNDDFDVLKGTDKNGNELSIQLNKGILGSKETINIVGKRNDKEKMKLIDVNVNVDIFNGDHNNAKKTFEFLALTTDVEWSLYSKGENGTNISGILTTSHDESCDYGYNALKNVDFSNLNQYDHIHPGGSVTPSGYYLDEASSDMKFIESLTRITNNKDIKFNIYTINNFYSPYKVGDRGSVSVKANRLIGPIDRATDEKKGMLILRGKN